MNDEHDCVSDAARARKECLQHPHDAWLPPTTGTDSIPDRPCVCLPSMKIQRTCRFAISPPMQFPSPPDARNTLPSLIVHRLFLHRAPPPPFPLFHHPHRRDCESTAMAGRDGGSAPRRPIPHRRQCRPPAPAGPACAFRPPGPDPVCMSTGGAGITSCRKHPAVMMALYARV